MNKLDSQLIDRRTFLKGSGAAALSLALGSCGSIGQDESQKQLNVFSWADYIHPDVIPAFEKRYGISVVYDTFASNEALMAKLQAGASNYDIVVPTSYILLQLKRLKLLAPIDKAKLSNFKNLQPRFRNTKFDPGCSYSIPYTWGTTGIGFNTTAFKNRAYPDAWDVFWDKRLAHRMTLLDDSRETIGMALKRRGYSFNTTTQDPIKQAFNDLKIQKPLVMCYTSDQVITQLASSDSMLALSFSGDVYQAAKENKNVRYIIPANGTSLWVDLLCIPESAPHVENAYRWINFLLEPEIASMNANYTRYATPNEKALKNVDAELLADKNLYPPDALLDKCEEIADVGQAIFFYDQIWTELKCV